MRRPSETVIVRPTAPLREGLAGALVAADFRIVASASPVRDLAPISASRNQPILLIIDASNEQDEVVSQIKLFKEQHPSGGERGADRLCASVT
jgi:DNA-binding NarL/FixJ family response regulator